MITKWTTLLLFIRFDVDEDFIEMYYIQVNLYRCFYKNFNWFNSQRFIKL